MNKFSTNTNTINPYPSLDPRHDIFDIVTRNVSAQNGEIFGKSEFTDKVFQLVQRETCKEEIKVLDDIKRDLFTTKK